MTELEMLRDDRERLIEAIERARYKCECCDTHDRLGEIIQESDRRVRYFPLIKDSQ